MTDSERRRPNRLVESVVGGALTFVLELAIVVGLGLVAYLVAALVLI